MEIVEVVVVCTIRIVKIKERLLFYKELNILDIEGRIVVPCVILL